MWCFILALCGNLVCNLLEQPVGILLALRSYIKILHEVGEMLKV